MSFATEQIHMLLLPFYRIHKPQLNYRLDFKTYYQCILRSGCSDNVKS